MLSSRGVDVLYDHGKAGSLNVGKIRSWFGTEFSQSALLADLDIAVVSRDSDRVIAVIEIEESVVNTKTLLGDLFGALLGDHLAFQGRELNVGAWTTLIVLARSSTHQTQVAFLQDQVNRLKPHLSTRNASISRIVVDVFKDEIELQEKLTQQVEKALAVSKT